jgi:hypothetical protein
MEASRRKRILVKQPNTAGSQVITLTDGKEPKPNRIDLKEKK